MRTTPHLVRLARHLVDDPADAEDVVMDAFTGLSRRWRQVRRTDDVFFYLRASVVNGCRSRVRRARVARLRRHTQVESDSAPAEQIAMMHLEHDDVVRALRLLSRRQREVLVLRYYDEASEAEIADTLGIGLGSVKTHASRGLHARSPTVSRRSSDHRGDGAPARRRAARARTPSRSTSRPPGEALRLRRQDQRRGESVRTGRRRRRVPSVVAGR